MRIFWRERISFFHSYIATSLKISFWLFGSSNVLSGGLAVFSFEEFLVGAYGTLMAWWYSNQVNSGLISEVS
jgi:hypothetical protein